MKNKLSKQQVRLGYLLVLSVLLPACANVAPSPPISQPSITTPDIPEPRNIAKPIYTQYKLFGEQYSMLRVLTTSQSIGISLSLIGELPEDSDPDWDIKDKTGNSVEAEYVGGATIQHDSSTIFLNLEPTTKPEALRSLYFNWNGLIMNFDIEIEESEE